MGWGAPKFPRGLGQARALTGRGRGREGRDRGRGGRTGGGGGIGPEHSSALPGAASAITRPASRGSPKKYGYVWAVRGVHRHRYESNRRKQPTASVWSWCVIIGSFSRPVAVNMHTGNIQPCSQAAWLVVRLACSPAGLQPGWFAVGPACNLASLPPGLLACSPAGLVGPAGLQSGWPGACG